VQKTTRCHVLLISIKINKCDDDDDSLILSAVTVMIDNDLLEKNGLNLVLMDLTRELTPNYYS